MKPAYIGIDLAVRRKKRLPVVIARHEGGRLIPYDLRCLSVQPPRGYGNAAILKPELLAKFAADTKTYLAAACELLSVSPAQIAIDAPQTPRDPNRRRRAAEFALDKAGISCFTTPSEMEFERIKQKVSDHLNAGRALARLPHANQLWMVYGFELFQTLSAVAPCIEVYPQAIVQALGAAKIHKSKQGAVQFQLRAASNYTGWPHANSDDSALFPIATAPRHDALDAYLSCWAASLDETDRVPLGEPPNDAIWLPRLDGLRKFESDGAETPAPQALLPKRPLKRRATSRTAASSSFVKTCPACNTYVFKRWPFGWDAHAGHRCSGVEATDYESRKAEFKTRFQHLFK